MSIENVKDLSKYQHTEIEEYPYEIKIIEGKPQKPMSSIYEKYYNKNTAKNSAIILGIIAMLGLGHMAITKIMGPSKKRKK